MNFYSLKTYTVRNEPYIFSMLDMPFKISEKRFILAAKKNSPILRSDRILRGMDIPDLYEGDILRWNSDEWLVQYMRGFRLINRKTEVKMLYEISDYEILGDIYTLDFPVDPAIKKELTFKYRDDRIRLSDITGMYKNKLIVRGVTDKLDPTELQLEAGLALNDRSLYFGDLIKGKPLELYYGRPCIKTSDGVYDIETNQLIGG